MEKFKQSLSRLVFCLFCMFSVALYQEAGSRAASKEDFAEIKSNIKITRQLLTFQGTMSMKKLIKLV